MKKKWLIFLMLGALLLNLMLVGCDKAEPPKDTTTEPFSAVDATIPLADDLVTELTLYLQQFHTDHDLVDTSFSIKLDQIIERGSIPLCVTFDPNDYYFACAYYNDPHDQDLIEKTAFCCAGEYTWVGFENESDITEVYKNAPLVVIFQINRAADCRNILSSGDPTQTVEHFQIYILYEEYVQDSLPFTIDDTFIYLTSKKQDVVYYTKDHYSNAHVTFPLVEVDGTMYISQPLSRTYPDGERYEWDLEWAFGEYYDKLIAVMITGRYSVTSANDSITHYGLFKIEDVSDIISE